ncbi:MAG: 5'-deoxynucleotidase [Planctomycetes bacterium]|nr:5'-deoxynucleotidase [Planctomycetota bacterium]
MSSFFFAYLSRMRLIRRWSLMRSNDPENIQEHSYRVAVLAHALASIGRIELGKTTDPERAAFLALFHDAGEVITGDMPTPVKYYDETIREAYRGIEAAANRRLLSFLPEAYRSVYQPALFPEAGEEPTWTYVRAADKLCAWIKCVEERRGGNREFLAAENSLRRSLDHLGLEEVAIFLREFSPGYGLSLDELSRADAGPDPEDDGRSGAAALSPSSGK